MPATSAATSAPAETGNVRVLAKPPVRKLAKDLGVDLTSLTGTGPNGAVTREDVQAAQVMTPVVSRQVQSACPRPAASGEREWREPIKGVRKMMGQAMVQLGVLDAPRHRVGHHRRHAHDGVRRPAEGLGASSATYASRRCWCWHAR